MSSRGEFLGTGPSAGIYQPKPTPALAEDLPVYINDELLDLGGRLNNVMEGGAFPPQASLPKRAKEGMMIYFTQPVKDYPLADSKIPDGDFKDYIISSAGLWLFKNNKWWKMVDDPTATHRSLQVYQYVDIGAAPPERPADNKYLPEDIAPWSYSPGSSSPLRDQYTCVCPPI